MIKEFLEIGEIVGTHGVRGEMRVNPWCDSPDYMAKFKTLYFAGNESCAVQVKSARPHGNIVLLRLDGVETVEAAQKMRGKVLFIKRSDAKLPKNQFFIVELIGCKVFDEPSGIEVGEIADVLQNTAQDIYQVKTASGKEVLIPAVGQFVKEVKIEERLVITTLIPGFLDGAIEA